MALEGHQQIVFNHARIAAAGGKGDGAATRKDVAVSLHDIVNRPAHEAEDLPIPDGIRVNLLAARRVIGLKQRFALSEAADGLIDAVDA